MPNPDLRKKDADPNDPRNVHTTRAANAPLHPVASRWLVIGVLIALAVALLVYLASG